MRLSIISNKYSIFGKYDFLEATPAVVAKLYELYGKDNFLPNMIQMIQIMQPQNTVTQISRPQFVNHEINCTITFLPDRIDVESGTELREEKVLGYLDKVINLFDLKVQRIALNTNAVWNEFSQEDLVKVKATLVGDKVFPYTSDSIEWSIKSVARKECSEINELINVGQNIQSIGEPNNGNFMINYIDINTDINTLGENSQERFGIEQCEAFYKTALKYNNEMFDKLKRII